MRTFVGIDPGLDGAIAGLVPGEEGEYTLYVDDTPTGKTKGKRLYFPAQMAQALKKFSGGREPPIVFIERVHSMPKQGVASSFNFGVGFGLWQGIVAGLNWPVELVTPQAWMKVMMTGQLRGKDAGRGRAMELWPEHVNTFGRVKDDGRADAALIAEYGRRSWRESSE